MTALMTSLVHSADVVLAGKRRESRELFRLEAPVEIREMARSELHPALRLSSDYLYAHETYTIDCDDDGLLWRPLVPERRRVRHGRNDLPGCEAEQKAMTLAELVMLLKGGGNAEDDPLQRRRGGSDVNRIYHGMGYFRQVDARPATAYPRLEDAGLKQLLWDDRAATLRRLGKSAGNLRLIDGKVWVREQEPTLQLQADPAERFVKVAPAEWAIAEYRYAAALRGFRLDRLADLWRWAETPSGRRAVVVMGGLKTQEIEMRSHLEVLDVQVLKRDDARVMLQARLPQILKPVGQLADDLNAEQVDSLVALQRQRFAEDETALATSGLFGHLEVIAGAIDQMKGLDGGKFSAVGAARAAILPVLGRWHAIDKDFDPQAPAQPVAVRRRG